MTCSDFNSFHFKLQSTDSKIFEKFQHTLLMWWLTYISQFDNMVLRWNFLKVWCLNLLKLNVKGHSRISIHGKLLSRAPPLGNVNVITVFYQNKTLKNHFLLLVTVQLILFVYHLYPEATTFNFPPSIQKSPFISSKLTLKKFYLSRKIALIESFSDITLWEKNSTVFPK